MRDVPRVRDSSSVSSTMRSGSVAVEALATVPSQEGEQGGCREDSDDGADEEGGRELGRHVFFFPFLPSFSRSLSPLFFSFPFFPLLSLPSPLFCLFIRSFLFVPFYSFLFIRSFIFYSSLFFSLACSKTEENSVRKEENVFFPSPINSRLFSKLPEPQITRAPEPQGGPQAKPSQAKAKRKRRGSGKEKPPPFS